MLGNIPEEKFEIIINIVANIGRSFGKWHVDKWKEGDVGPTCFLLLHLQVATQKRVLLSGCEMLRSPPLVD